MEASGGTILGPLRAPKSGLGSDSRKSVKAQGSTLGVSLGDSQGVTEEPSHRGGVGYIVPCCRFCVFSALGYETFWLLAASGGFLVAPGGEKSRTLVLFWASWCPQAAKSLVP